MHDWSEIMVLGMGSSIAALGGGGGEGGGGDQRANVC
jgi:hypothetical protein